MGDETKNLPEIDLYRIKWTGDRSTIVGLLQGINSRLDTTNIILGEIRDRIPENLEVLLSMIADNTLCACEALNKVAPPDFYFERPEIISKNVEFKLLGETKEFIITSKKGHLLIDFDVTGIPEWLDYVIEKKEQNYILKLTTNTKNSIVDAVIKIVQKDSLAELTINASKNIYILKALSKEVSQNWDVITQFVRINSFKNGNIHDCVVTTNNPDWPGVLEYTQGLGMVKLKGIRNETHQDVIVITTIVQNDSGLVETIIFTSRAKPYPPVIGADATSPIDTDGTKSLIKTFI